MIEDDADTLDALRVTLELDGHRVDTAESGRRGLEVALSRRPEVVLIDIGLPGIDGYEVARRLRQELGPDVMLVALSGRGQHDDHRRARDAGCDRHLLKPVDRADLRRVLASER